MNRDALLLYLRDLRDLEFAKKKIEVIYSNEQQKYEQNIQDLSENIFYEIPDSSEQSGWSFGMILGIIILGVLSIGTLYCMIFGTVTEREYFEDSRAFTGQGVRYVDIPVWETNLFIILFIGLLIFLFGILYLWSTAVKITKENKEIIENAKKHNAEETLHVKENEELTAQLQIQWKQCSEYLIEEYKKVNLLLKANYDLNILANPYRNLASVYYIYDYMSSSRESLKDTLIHEHMENGIQRILAKLDRIIQQQQEIIFQTRKLEAQNNKIIEQNVKLLDSLRRIESNVEIIAQYSEFSANYSKANAYFGLANYLGS